MKKQSSGQRVDRQDVSMVTPSPGQTMPGSKPHGVHTRERGKPTQLSAGAAESKTQPVEVPHRSSGSTASGTHSTKSRTR